MAKPPHQAKDTAWKDILDAYFKEFIAFCLLDLYALIDWSKPWVSLDKELHAISKNDMIGRKLVDKLFSVYLNDGSEKWILIHLEIQDEPEEIFPERMFIYSYRIYDKYQRIVVSCAVLTDKNASWRPDHYEVALAGSKLRLDFRVIKLLDYRGQEAALEISSNIFASVILSHLTAQRVRKGPSKVRAKTKFDLTRRLYKKGYNKIQVQKLFLFIDWLLHLSAADEIEYREAVYQLEAEQNMAYISTIENFGIQKGLQKGLQQGLQQGEYLLLMRLIKHKFHIIPEKYQQKLSSASADELLIWGEQLLDADSLEDVFK